MRAFAPAIMNGVISSLAAEEVDIIGRWDNSR
jgi:hypothetical protein